MKSRLSLGGGSDDGDKSDGQSLLDFLREAAADGITSSIVITLSNDVRITIDFPDPPNRAA